MLCCLAVTVWFYTGLFCLQINISSRKKAKLVDGAVSLQKYYLFFLVWLWTIIYNDQIDSGSNIQQDIPDKQVDKSTAIVSSEKNVKAHQL